MYNRITFENYKIFKSRQELELRPITILFGKNNAGKSAILKLPLLIANAFRGKSEEVMTPEFNQRELFADIRDLVYNRANRAVEIGVFDDQNERSLEYSFYVDNEKDIKSHIEKWKFRNKSVEDVRNDEDHTELYKFEGVIPVDCSAEEREAIDELNTFVDYIGNIRAEASRDMRLSTLTECSGWQGEKGYAHLLKDALSISSQLGNKVSEWYNATFPGWSVKVDTVSNPIFHVNVVNGNIVTNIADAGFGISQSLPVVIRACRQCSRPTLIVLEEPEAHLHPAAQGNLGELIANSVKDDLQKQYLIETHSFNFILRIRSLIASGLLSKDQVALYYVDYNDDLKLSALSHVVVDDNGMVKNWPTGVFEETYDEVIRIRMVANNIISR